MQRGTVFFFFQAEDGIRDLYVTGVQTCALPICVRHHVLQSALATRDGARFEREDDDTVHAAQLAGDCFQRSEERRVGKSVDLGGSRMIKKKKNIEIMIPQRQYRREGTVASVCFD